MLLATSYLENSLAQHYSLVPQLKIEIALEHL